MTSSKSPTKTSRRNKRKVGRALNWTPEQIEALATVTDADIIEASALWRRNAGKLANLLDAEPLEQNAEPVNPNP